MSQHLVLSIAAQTAANKQFGFKLFMTCIYAVSILVYIQFIDWDKLQIFNQGQVKLFGIRQSKIY